MNLLKFGKVVLASGKVTSWKIDCDDLSVFDWGTAAYLAEQLLDAQIGLVEGVPEGGLAFADSLSVFSTTDGKLTIVDDVLTTGESMEHQRAGRDAQGVVLFARGPCPSWVKAIFTTNEELWT